MAEHSLRATGAQRIGVVDALTTGQRRVDERHRFVAGVGVTGRASQLHVLVEELTQTQALGEGRWLDQPGVGNRVVIVEVGCEPI
jgi:hypothetical protein